MSDVCAVYDIDGTLRIIESTWNEVVCCVCSSIYHGYVSHSNLCLYCRMHGLIRTTQLQNIVLIHSLEELLCKHLTCNMLRQLLDMNAEVLRKIFTITHMHT